MAAKTFPVALTFDQLTDVVGLIKGEFEREKYWANRPDDEVADEVSEDEVDEEGKPVVLKSRRWEREARVKGIAQCDRLSNLHYAITGAYLSR